MTGAALLDVNVLVALFDPDHIHHDIAHDWFGEHAAPGWATCPLTENGFLRTVNHLRKSDFVPIPDLIGHLARFQEASVHEFWPDDLSLLDGRHFQKGLIQGRRQLTDIYLLGLAVRHEGRLVTFDRGIAISTIRGARKEHLVLLAADA